MALVHAAIGLGEALITGAVVRFLLLTRPDLLDGGIVEGGSTASKRGGIAVAGLAISLAVATFLAPFASENPDGLEYVGGEKLNILPTEGTTPPPPVAAPIPDYAMPGLSRSKSLATAAAGVVGTLVVFGVGLGLARSLSGPGPGSTGPLAPAPELEGAVSHEG